MKPKILVLYNDTEQITSICSALAQEGFEVVAAKDSDEGLRRVYDTLPSLVILDDQLSRSGSLDLCPWIYQLACASIILLGEEGEMPLLDGLCRGADFYMSKPFSLLELVARVKALLRRRKMLPQNSGEQLDAEEQRVFLGETSMELTPTEVRFLAYLVLNQGRVVSHQELLTQVWGGETVVSDIVKCYVARLRQKLDHGTPHYIFTHRGSGYRFDYSGGRDRPSDLSSALPESPDISGDLSWRGQGEDDPDYR